MPLSRRHLVFSCLGCAVLGGALGFGAARLFPPPAENGGGRAHRAGWAAGAATAAEEAAQNTRAGGGGAPESGLLENIATDELRARLGRWLAAGAPGGPARNAALECLAEWARRDAWEALKFVHEAAVFPGRNEACALPLARIGREDMPAVIAWLRANLSERDRAVVAHDVLAHLVHDAPRQAAELVLADGIPGETTLADEMPWEPYYLGEVIQSLMRTSPGEALALFERLPESGKSKAAADFVSAWLQTDPASALAWCERNRDTLFNGSASYGLLHKLLMASSPHLESTLDRLRLTPDQMDLWSWDNYCQRFPDKALARLQASPGGVSSTFVNRLTSALFSSGSPDEALEVLKLCLPSADAGRTLYDSWDAWARSDRKAAEAWLETMPDAEIRAQLRDKARAKDSPAEFLQTAGADADPEAVHWAAMHITVKDNVGQGVLLDFMGRNPGYFQDDRAQLVVEGLIEKGVEPTAMLAVIEQIPPGSTRDRTLAAAAGAWAGNGDTALAASLASAIGDPDTRAARLFDIYGEMRRRDPAAAAGWLAAQPLPPEVRASWEAIAKGREE